MYWGNYLWLIINQLCGSYFELESFLTFIFISKYTNWHFPILHLKRTLLKKGHMLQNCLKKSKSEAHTTCPLFA